MTVSVKIRAKGNGRPYLLYYIDPDTKREKSKSAETQDRDEALKAAARWEDELLAFRGKDGTGWDYFRRRFRDEHLGGRKSRKTVSSFATALNAFARIKRPACLSEITASSISEFKLALERAGHPEGTVGNYLTHLRTALRWAARIELIPKAPTFPVLSSSSTGMRGRPITEKEFQQILKACNFQNATYGYAKEWQRFIELLWYSGLRLNEAARLTWDEDYPRVSLAAKPFPVIVFTAASQKSRKPGTSLIAPDFKAWLLKTPPSKRHGLVAPVLNDEGELMPIDKASDRVSQICAMAGVTVSEKGKSGSSQNFRQAYGTRWAAIIRPFTLRQMMRHADIRTTLNFYVGYDSADAGADLYASSQTVPSFVPKRARKPRNAGRQNAKKGRKN